MFSETFDGAPGGPQPFTSPNWDIAVHSRDTSSWYQLEPMDMQHGPDCSPPMAVHHDAGAYADAVFQCKDHLMTAIQASGYGLIELTPNRLLDFSQGEAVIRFDVSTLRTSFRDWIDVWITPFADNLQLPFNDGEVDLQGVPRNAVNIRFGAANGNGTDLVPTIYRDFQDTGDFPPFSSAYNWYTGYEQFLQPSATRRDTVEIHLSRTHLKVGMPAYHFWWVDKAITPLSWSQGVVQFGHHSYNPAKADGCGLAVCTANTWHWDNISLSPAVPFTLIKADRRYVDQSDQEVRFGQAAPAHAYLRFSGIGRITVSVDGGQTWEAARRQPSSQLGVHVEHLANYWMAVPAGTQRVRLRFGPDPGATQTYTGPYIAKDFALWARPALGVQQAQP